MTAHLLPLLERECRRKLAAQGRDDVAQALGDRLWRYASEGPLQVHWGLLEQGLLERWMGCGCWHVRQTLLLKPPGERQARTQAPPAATNPIHATQPLSPPYTCWPQVKLVDEDGYVSERRVMACAYGGGKPATTFVMLDASGALVDFLHCPQLRWVGGCFKGKGSVGVLGGGECSCWVAGNLVEHMHGAGAYEAPLSQC